ncbi:MAG: hypothetical protein ACMV0Y_09015 [Paludibacter sp.]
MKVTIVKANDKIMKEEKVRKGQLCNIEMAGFAYRFLIPYC